jgi:RNA polymerase-binding protein DksA
VPLNSKQLHKLEQALDADYARLLEEVRSAFEARGEHQYAELVNRDPADPGDASVADLLANVSLAEIDRHVAEIRDVDAARDRIKDGSYGICIDCSTEIVFERMLAHPTAKRCLPCQQLRERIYAGEETPTL